MANAETRDDKVLYGDRLAEAEKIDKSWSGGKLTALGVTTFVLAIIVIVFMATRMTTCMYLDGSQP